MKGYLWQLRLLLQLNAALVQRCREEFKFGNATYVGQSDVCVLA